MLLNDYVMLLKGYKIISYTQTNYYHRNKLILSSNLKPISILRSVHHAIVHDDSLSTSITITNQEISNLYNINYTNITNNQNLFSTNNGYVLHNRIVDVNSNVPIIEANRESFQPFSGIINDMKRRKPYYKSDWTDGFQRKSISAILFLFFACLAPTVAFGGLTSIITDGNMGVIEFIISCGFSGMFYAIFSGQPMTFLGPTGLTLAFIAALFRYTKSYNLPFMGIYCWTGLWTSFFIALSSIFNLSQFIKYCTRFTDDCFNALLSINFVYEAVMSILRNFSIQTSTGAADISSGLTALYIALTTWFSTKTLVKMKQSKLFNSKIRKFLADFGPSLVIVIMSFIASHPIIKSIGIEKLSVPSSFALSYKLRSISTFFIPHEFFTLSKKYKLLTIFPAFLLSLLFYFDQNISVRAVNSFNNHNQMKKGEAYHLDMLILAIIVSILSLYGLPWTCAATVQSLNHVRTMSDIDITMSPSLTVAINNDNNIFSSSNNEEKLLMRSEGNSETKINVIEKIPSTSMLPNEVQPPNTLIAPTILNYNNGDNNDNDYNSEFDKLKLESIQIPTTILETRVTGFVIHLLILSSLLTLPLLKMIPIPVISGIFLYLGRKLMKTNLYFIRLSELFIEKKLLPS
eukprot:gene11681-15642_t